MRNLDPVFEDEDLASYGEHNIRFIQISINRKILQIEDRLYRTMDEVEELKNIVIRNAR